mmetsp:Transcript_4255/g.5606  ORF Transcript_4255/g.5606 Transcript_4255/m.5606 type:complete len:202 (-) Transcript_4255:174-779(-)
MKEKNDGKDEEVLLCESLIVAEYVAERFGSNDGVGILPSKPEDRAVMRLFSELCGSSFSYFPILRAADNDDDDSQKKFQDAVSTLQDALKNVDVFLTHYDSVYRGDGSSGPFLFGSQFSLAEVNAAPFVQRACTILPAFLKEKTERVDPMEICDELGLMRLKSWMEAVLSRPSVVATGVPKEDLLSGTTRMLERFKAMEKN